MADPILLYSTNTWLAYIIAQRFYNSEHYVWCTPFFDPRSLATYDATVPPTSSPSEIYRNLYEEARRGDRHSAKIKENQTGILRGANFKRGSGIITEEEEKDKYLSKINCAFSRAQGAKKCTINFAHLLIII